MRGNEIAAALAVFCGKSRYGLEVLKDATPEDLARARSFIEEGRLVLKPNGRPGVYVEATASHGEETGTAIIRDSHANITEVRRNGRPLSQTEGPGRRHPRPPPWAPSSRRPTSNR